MRKIEEFRSYILETEFKMNIFKQAIDIINYVSISHFDSDMIIVSYENGDIKIKGNNLVITKLLVDEVLITGNIKQIIFGEI